MSPRTPTLPPNEPTMWRRLIARAHPDAGGTHELFIWAGAVRDVVCNLRAPDVGSPKPEDHPSRRRKPSTWRPTHADNRERIPYPSGDSSAFKAATAEALRMAGEFGTGTVYGALLAVLVECKPSAEYVYREERGASYRQLAAIAHAVGMSKEARTGWYRLAESIPLSDAHAGHLLGRLKSAAA